MEEGKEDRFNEGMARISKILLIVGEEIVAVIKGKAKSDNSICSDSAR